MCNDENDVYDDDDHSLFIPSRPSMGGGFQSVQLSICESIPFFLPSRVRNLFPLPNPIRRP